MQANLKRTAPAIALTLALLLGVAFGLGRGVAYAADGDLDFMITTDFAGGLDEARAVAVQPDGKVVAAGSTQLGGPDTSDFALARYNSDSSLDTAFGNGGRVTTDFFGGDDVAHDVAVQPDGKIVAAGAAHWPGSNSSEFAVARYNPDGSPDVTFGNSGRVTLTIQGSIQNAAYSIALQPDGRIVLAGHTLSGFGDPRFGLARLNPDGPLDPTFGTSGTTRIGFGGLDDQARGVVVQSDGKIVAVGYTSADGFNADFAIARFDQNGILDFGFGVDGKVTTDFFTGDDRANGISLQPDGKIVAAGHASQGGGNLVFALTRYNPNGSLDPNFDGDGKVATNFVGSSEMAASVALQLDGKIIAGGHATNGLEDFALARYDAGGVLDHAFGAGGMVTTDFGGSSDRANDLALQPDGKIVLAGRGGNADFALARYLSGGPPSPTPTPTSTPTPTPGSYPLFGDAQNLGDGYTEFTTSYGNAQGAWAFYSNSSNPGVSALLGSATNSTGGTGVVGIGTRGVYGLSSEESGGLGDGVVGETNAYGRNGVYGLHTGTYGYGVYGSSTGSGGFGVFGIGTGSTGYGVYGASNSNYGVIGYSANGFGVLGYSGTNRAGYFAGNVRVTGTLSKGAGSFKIDHPLDPANKYLYHSFVESPDMMNIYNGNATLDAKSEAVVTLPDWFEALNRDFRYQLTAIGAPGPNLYVAEKVKGNRFKIAGGAPGMEVSWQVTGIRHDPYAEKNRIPVEEAKTGAEKGRYLHPTEWGKPDSLGADYEERQRIEQAAPAPAKP